MTDAVLRANLDIPIAAIRTYCRTQPIAQLALFGSVLRSDFSPDSDVDVLVTFVPDAPITYFDLYDIQTHLATLFGREVDLVTPNALSDYFRDDVLSEAEVIYAAE